MTQMSEARAGRLTPEMKAVAKEEKVPEGRVLKGVASGRMVIPFNEKGRRARSVGIGEGLRVKVNANLGTSPDFASMEEELEKAEAALKYGADTLMDLSTGGDIDAIRRKVLELPAPLGTVPIYQAVIEGAKESGSVVNIDEDKVFQVIERHAKDGVDFVTVHAGITREALSRLRSQGRITNIVSRGGAFTASWMLHQGKENPLYRDFEYLLEIAGEYDLTLSLGDAMRPGSMGDASDRAQIQELIILGELVDRARKEDVQAMVEGPGHVPLNEIEANVVLQKKLCRGAPFYVLGPLVTDIAPGYDHISGAIGGAIAAYHGADFLCYVTPSEHLALPTLEDVRQGVIASRIAAHAADAARGRGDALDREMSVARAELDWKGQFGLSLDPERAKDYRKRRVPESPEVCTMCGEFCALKIVKEHLKGSK